MEPTKHGSNIGCNEAMRRAGTDVPNVSTATMGANNTPGPVDSCWGFARKPGRFPGVVKSSPAPRPSPLDSTVAPWWPDAHVVASISARSHKGPGTSVRGVVVELRDFDGRRLPAGPAGAPGTKPGAPLPGRIPCNNTGKCTGCGMAGEQHALLQARDSGRSRALLKTRGS